MTPSPPTSEKGKKPSDSDLITDVLAEYRLSQKRLEQEEARMELAFLRDRRSRRKRETRCKIILGGALMAAFRHLTTDVGDMERRSLLLSMLRGAIDEERDQQSVAEFFPELFASGKEG